MTTELLQEFYILATLLNFSRAAENLFISQSVLSRHMKALEGELSVRLFIRDTHHVSLTEEGRLLLREAGPLIRKAERAESVHSGVSAEISEHRARLPSDSFCAGYKCNRRRGLSPESL